MSNAATSARSTDQTLLIKYAIHLALQGSPRECNELYRQKEFQEDLRRFGKDVFYMDFSYSQRKAFYTYVNNRLLGDVPVDYLEFGVAHGASLRDWTSINRHEGSRFIGFDSFEGLPENWTLKAPKGAFSTKGAPPKIDDKRVNLVKGLFQETVDAFSRSFESRNRLVLHMDADLYSSTLYVFMNLDRHIERGTIVLFDEFNARNYTDEYAALKDYCRACNRDYAMLAARPDHAKVAVEIL